jgi:hypothetical protein
MGNLINNLLKTKLLKISYQDIIYKNKLSKSKLTKSKSFKSEGKESARFVIPQIVFNLSCPQFPGRFNSESIRNVIPDKGS